MIGAIAAPRVLGYQLGRNSRWCVQPGDHVLKGSPIAQGERWQHAAASGVVTSVSTLALIEVREDQQEVTMPPLDAETTSARALIERVQTAGIEGLGGAGYPTHLKLLAAIRHKVHTVVINAIECESGINCDKELARFHADNLLPALTALLRLPGIHQLTIACSPQSRPAITGKFEIRELPRIQPTDGEERRLLRTLFDVDIPRHALPVQAGYVVINLGTLFAISEALAGMALIRRLVTLTDGVRWVPIGVPIASLVSTPLFRSGGPLSGVVSSLAQNTAHAFVNKTTNAIFEVTPTPAFECIRCGRCDASCPEHLPVAQLLACAGAGQVARLSALKLESCIQCGLCNPVCPSHIDVLAGLRTGLVSLHEERQRKVQMQEALARSSRHVHRLAELERVQADRRAARLDRLRQDSSDD